MQRLLICGTNWLGDSIMSMPALQLLKRTAPATRVTLLTKPGMMPLWEMHAAVDSAIPVYGGWGGARRTVPALRRQSFDRAVIFPNSFRSALLPFLARVPERVGTAGHWRRAMLTRCVSAREPGDRTHQAWEYVTLLGLDAPDTLEPPCITPSDQARKDAAALLDMDDSAPLVAVLPGAARGGSKRWPAECFADVARQLVASRRARVVLLGTQSEQPACDHVAAALGASARNLAGRTSLAVLTAALQRCRVALANDSGGMHLASAAGTPVVAIFGMTEPDVTGPLGARDRILCGAGSGQRSRDIPRESAEAETALRNVTPGQVFMAARDVLDAS